MDEEELQQVDCAGQRRAEHGRAAEREREQQVRPLTPQQVPAQPPPGALRWLWQRTPGGQQEAPS
jgi:hypothetical protein